MAIENETPLEQRARDYARAGWTVTSRALNSITLENADKRVRLWTDAEGTLQVDGPALPAFAMDGRIRAWILLLALLAAAFAVAWAAGFFR